MGKRHRAGRRGLTLVELMLAMAILAVAILALMMVIFSAASLQHNSREKTLAYNAARKKIEEMRDSPFSLIYARYNASTVDNPAGLSSPGDTFDVAPLPRVTAGTPVGKIEYPESGGILREDIHRVNPGLAAGLGMPSGKDLNRDGALDSASRNADHKVLPVRITVRWKSGRTPTQIEVSTFITEK